MSALLLVIGCIVVGTVLLVVNAVLTTGKQADIDMGCYDDEMDNQ